MESNLPIKIEVPVLIIGGGPVGLACAIELSWQGVECLLIEQRDGSISHPKMNQVSVRTTEFCRRWGISQKVRDSSIPEDFPRSIRFVTSTSGYQLAHYDFPSRKDEPCIHSPEAMQRCSQIYFDPILRDHARSIGGANFAYSHRLVSFEQDKNRVIAKIVSLETGAVTKVRADYMVACDGADSLVRNELGIKLQGDMSMNFNVNAFFRTTDHEVLFKHGRAVMQWIIDENGVWADIVSINGDDLWRFSLMRVLRAQIPTKREICKYLFKAAGCRIEHEILSILPWERRRVVAEKFQVGRVLLCGDAVHQLSPTGGFGMNTGIQEAVDAAWKIAAVIMGWGGQRLVDSYDMERRPVAWNIVNEAARNYDQFAKLPTNTGIVLADEGSQKLRDAIGQAIYNEKFDREYDMEGVPLGYCYEESPIILADGTQARPFEVMKYHPTARPGHRAPHAWLDDGRSILDLYGRGFTLLCFDSTVDTSSIVESALKRRMPMAIESIDNEEIFALYGRKLVLVRPDGHVAWRNDSPPEDAGNLIDKLRGAL